MTTNLNTRFDPDAVAELPNESSPAVLAGFPDPAVLTQLANEWFTSLPGGQTGVAEAKSVPARAVASSGIDLPDPSTLELLPAGIAGATGQSPDDIAAPPALEGSESMLYFLKGSKPTTPDSIPGMRPDLHGLDPGLSSVPANAISVGGPRAQSGRSTIPGTHHLSTPPATPFIESGSNPLAGHIAPASAFDVRQRTDSSYLPGLLNEARNINPTEGKQPSVGHSGLYFMDGGSQIPGQEVRPALNLEDQNIHQNLPKGPEPGFSGVRSPGVSVPVSAAELNDQREFPNHTGGSPVTSSGEAGSLSLYFLDEVHSLSGFSADTPKDKDRPGIPGSAHPGFDVNAVRRDFPILNEKVNGRPLIWLDNAATTQKPQAVIDRLSYFYQHENSNIHRAAHELAARATDAYEAARSKVTRFINASSNDEIIFVRGTTEGINLIAKSWGKRNIGKGDVIVISWLEHHANIVPWQQLCAETGAQLKVAPVDNDGQIILDEYEKLLGSNTKLVAFSQVSNALGTVTPARIMIEMAHRHGAKVLLDGAQSVSHMRTDVQALDCDWFVFSGHKVFGPTGIGAVYGKLDLLNATPPWQGGGNMIQDVTFEKTLYHPAPARFEAGTGNIADAVGLGAALDYVERIGIENIEHYEHQLLLYATQGLLTIPGLTIIGTAAEKAGVISFVLEGFRSEDIGEALNREGIAVRSGHHCAQPILRRFGQETTVRPSLAFYNTCAEIDVLVDTVRKIKGGSYALQR